MLGFEGEKALAFDLAISNKCLEYEAKNMTGEYWYFAVFKALGMSK
jgi:hypothetical protein